MNSVNNLEQYYSSYFEYQEKNLDSDYDKYPWELEDTHLNEFIFGGQVGMYDEHLLFSDREFRKFIHDLNITDLEAEYTPEKTYHYHDYGPFKTHATEKNSIPHVKIKLKPTPTKVTLPVFKKRPNPKKKGPPIDGDGNEMVWAGGFWTHADRRYG